MKKHYFSLMNKWRLPDTLRKTIICLVLFTVAIPLTLIAQNLKLNFNLGTPIKISTVIKEIRTKTGYSFYYNNQKFDDSKTVSFETNNLSFETIMLKILGTGFTYIKEGQKIIIKEKVAVNNKQNPKKITIKGKVTDEGQNPVAGATILIPGTSQGAISDASGAFQMDIEPGEQIEVNFVGMETNLQTITKGGDVLIKMKNSALVVEDVVVTGIFERKKESFTGSSSTFTSKELKNVGTQNILQSLKSLDPALNITENNQYGSDPNRTPDMEIRGKSSVIGLKEQFGEDPNQPLFILDGFETTLSVIMDLSLDRVASVTILKDAASTAIYGSKAANGVIVVETKAPEKGRLRVSYNGNMIISFADLSAYNLMNSSEKLEFEQKAGRFKADSPSQQEDLNNRYNYYYNEIERGVDTYWMAEPLRIGINHRHGVNVEGGNDEIRYGVGFSYNGNNGVMKQSGRDIIGGNVDIIYRKNKLTFSNKLAIDFRKSTDPIVAFKEFSRANPYYRKTNELGGYDKFLENNTSDNAADYVPVSYEVSNPMWNYMQSSYNNGEEFAFRNNTSLEYNFVKALRMRMRLGISKSTTESEAFASPEETQFENDEITKKGTYRNSRTDSFSYNGDMSITYGNLIAEYHQVNAVIGVSANENSSESKSYASEGFPNGGFSIPSFANKYPDSSKPSYSDYLKRGVSLYFNGGYSFDNRYLFDVNFRKDGSSVFGSNRRYTNTWSTGIAWNIHNEKFMDNASSIVNLLKLRFSIGNPSNQNFGSFQTLTTYSFTNWMQNNFGTGVSVASFGNSDLDWQKTLDKNIGIDITLFKNRLRINADYYHKLTDPLLANISMPLSVGVSSKMMNVGEQISRGFNATINYALIYKPENRINWTINASLRNGTTYFDNIGAELTQANKANLSKSLTRYYDKARSSYLWSVQSLGIDSATGRELFLTKDGTYTFDYNTEDEVVVGDSNPTLEGVIGSNLRYKGFSFSISLRYKFGGDAFNRTLYQKVENITSEGIKSNQDRRALYDRWEKPGDIAKFKSISTTSSTRISSRFVQPDDYISFESIRAGYEFSNNKFVNNMGISGLTINAYMNEILRLGTIKDERGIDYPFARSISVSLSFNF